MDVGAPEVFRRDDLPGRGLHQGRAREEDGALVADDDRLVAHGGDVGATGGATAHDDGDLRDAERRHRGLVVEDPAEMVAVGENLVLVRQVGAAAVHQVQAGQPVLLRDLLRAEVLLDSDGVVGAALHRGVVGDDDAFAAGDAADAGDHAAGGDVAAVHAMGRERRELEERRAGIEQPLDAFARQQLAAREVAGARGFRAAERGLRGTFRELGKQRPRVRRIRPELRTTRIKGGSDSRHIGPPPNSWCPEALRPLAGGVRGGQRPPWGAGAIMPSPGTTRARSACVGSRSSPRRSHTAWRRAAVALSGFR